MSDAGFYVYLYFRPDTGEPCYVGKGKGRRWREHALGYTSHNGHLKAIIAKANGDMPIVIIRSDLTEREAFDLERAFIKTIGREPNGPLVNFTDGGEGTSGLVLTDAHKEKLRVASSRPERLAVLAKRNRSEENLERLRRLAADPDRRAKASEASRRPEHLKFLTEMNRTPETRERNRIQGRLPDRIARLNANANNPEWKKRRSTMSREPEHLRRLLEHNTSEAHRRQVGDRNRTPEMRAAASKGVTKRNYDPRYQMIARMGQRMYLDRQRDAKELAKLADINAYLGFGA